MMRLFIGLTLTDAVRARLAMLARGLPGARWIDPENYHLTLRFIGEADDTTARDIDANLQRIRPPAFSLEFAGLGTFGTGRKARSLWVRAEPNPALSHLQAKIESACVRAGCAPESRKFTPHVTLAKFRDARPDRIQSYVEGHGLFRTGPMEVEAFTLFESRMGKGASVYLPLADYALDLTLAETAARH